MIIVLNGPIGIGKSTLAEALTESIERCVMLDGDKLLAANPPPPNELEHLHSIVALLVTYYQRLDYRHFVINHAWRTAADLADLRRRVATIEPDAVVRCFLLTLPADENLRRIERRQRARAIDEREFELRTFAEESQAFSKASDLGEVFDVSASPAELVEMMLRRLGFATPPPHGR
jgi:thymidylate kinase